MEELKFDCKNYPELKFFKMNKLIFSIALFFLSTFLSVAQNALSLQEAIDLGIKNNLDVNQSDFAMQKQNIALKQTKAFMLPDLNANANHGINQGRSIDPFTNSYINQNVNYASYGASTSVLLFNGSSLQNRIKQNSLAYDAAKMEWQQAKDNVTINIILAYLQILSAEDVLAQSRQQAVVSNRQAERLEILNREGAISPSELYDVKGQVANEQLTIADNEAALEIAKLNLCQLMNIPYDRNLKVQKLPEEPMSMSKVGLPETIYATALDNFAQIKAVRFRTLSADKAIRAARGELFPTLLLNGNLNSNYSSAASQSFFLNTTPAVSSNYVEVNGNQYPVIIEQNNFKNEKIKYGDQVKNNLFSSVNIGLSIPIFNASQTRNKIKLAKIDFENNNRIEDNAKTELQQSIERAYLNATNALNKYTILQSQVAAFEESFRSADVRFNAGAINSVDYLIAKNNLDKAQTNLIIARYDFTLRTKVLEYYKGEKNN